MFSATGSGICRPGVQVTDLDLNFLNLNIHSSLVLLIFFRTIQPTGLEARINVQQREVYNEKFQTI